jgi:hypothetical protein
MKVRIIKIEKCPEKACRRVFFEREDGAATYAEIPDGHPNQTWAYLSEGSYVRGLVLKPDTGLVSPDSDIVVIPEGRENEEQPRELKLEEPWWGAGTNLKWGLVDRCGFGISKTLYNSGNVFIIKTNYGDFRIDKATIEEFAKTHNVSDTRKGTPLVIIPRELCQKI